jgi:pimeloyl-ACP methyl ester carboxylesterase
VQSALPSAAEIRHAFVEANGLRFHVANCGEGEGDRLALFLHGFPECWYSWRHQLPLMARLGYRAWAPELRGYGESDRPSRVQDYAIEKLMADVQGLIDASGAREVVLIGHDWGAIIAWYFAMRFPEAIDRLVIMNVPHPGAAEKAFESREQRRKSWYALFFQLPWLPERLLGLRRARPLVQMFRQTGLDESTFPDEAVRIHRENALRPGARKAMLDYYRALFRGGGAKRQKALGFPMIETPTLMIWGEQDIALTKQTTFGTDRFVKDLTLRYLPDASHWVQQDDPATVNRMLEAWLAGDPVPGNAE